MDRVPIVDPRPNAEAGFPTGSPKSLTVGLGGRVAR